jgi:broad specificity phosphatase PhoE
MQRIYLVQTGETTWQAESRLESVAGAPLSEAGAAAIRAVGEQLRAAGVSPSIYAAHGEAEVQTARLLAKALDVKVHANAHLGEIDYGLWQGLTHQQIKRGQPRLFRQWSEDPASVTPPQGETMAHAWDRIVKAVKGILKRRRNGPPLFVLAPVAMALLRCAIERGRLEKLRTFLASPFTWGSCEIRADRLQVPIPGDAQER